VSLDSLAQEVGRALGEARGLFGSAPAPGRWGTDGLSDGRDAAAQATGAAAQRWQGAGGSRYASEGEGSVAVLDSAVGADSDTAAEFGATAEASSRGGIGMDAVIDDTRAGVAAVAPSTDTPAGQAQLVAHLQQQLRRAKALLLASERRNVELAVLIRTAAARYRSGVARPAMPMAARVTWPPAITAGAQGGAGVPHLARSADVPAAPAPASAVPCANGPQTGTAAATAVRAALSKIGCPYVWGAKGPDAFDCSGLARWSWGQAGVTLGGDTYSQIEQGVPVDPNDVQAGDLIFPTASFGEGGRPGPGHVMLAISATECIEAQQTGVPVKISPMPSAFVARRPVAG
jgi:peptidoglycan DL-endopeptidase CwlO